MKSYRRAALGLAIVLAVAIPRPAQAAGPYTILAQGTTPFQALGYAFQVSRCSMDVFNSPANGVETRIVNISAFAGKTIRLTWTSPASAAGVKTGLHFQAQAFTGACNGVAMSAADWSPTRNTMTMVVPGDAKWAAFSALGNANVSFTVS